MERQTFPLGVRVNGILFAKQMGRHMMENYCWNIIRGRREHSYTSEVLFG